MVEVRLLQMFLRGCKHRAQSTVARVSMWVFSDTIGPCSGCHCRGEGSGRGGVVVVVVQADTLISVTRLLERLGLPMPILAGQPSDVVWVWCMKVVELSRYHWGGEKPRNLMFPKGEQV
jgi:hypothetical protein